MILVTDRQLSSGDFGRFYTGWTVLNIIVTPGVIVALLLSGSFRKAFQRGDNPLLVASLLGSARQLVFPTLIFIGLLELGFKVGGKMLGIDAPLLRSSRAISLQAGALAGSAS